MFCYEVIESLIINTLTKVTMRFFDKKDQSTHWQIYCFDKVINQFFSLYKSQKS